MKKALKIIAVVIVIGIIAIQFNRPARENIPIVQAETLEATTQLPENVDQILKRSCNDCHTNQTNWVWYSNIAPISWGMVDHVNDGRKELNFSKWATYNSNRKDHKLDEICEQVETGEMPHYQYLWLHWNASLSKDDVKTLCDWTSSEKKRIAQTVEEVQPAK